MDTQRLRASRTWTLAPTELRPWLLLLWITAWDEIPAGSYEADDELVAAKIGMPFAMFQTHRAMLMRGWRRHSDGRLYHDHITKMVLDRVAWKAAETVRKQKYRDRLSHGTDAGHHGTDAGSHGIDDAGVGVGVGVGVGGKPTPKAPPSLRSGGRSKAKSKALRPPPAEKPAGGVAPTVQTWDAYSTAYFNRYGTPPVRNATVNGQLANLVARLGKEEAPQVAAFYCGLNGRRYVQGGHSVGLLLHDAEKLRTTWATGSTGDTTTDVFSKLIRDAEEGERHEGDE